MKSVITKNVKSLWRKKSFLIHNNALVLAKCLLSTQKLFWNSIIESAVGYSTEAFYYELKVVYPGATVYY